VKEEIARQEIIKYWMERAYESLQSARSEEQAEDLSLQLTGDIMLVSATPQKW